MEGIRGRKRWIGSFFKNLMPMVIDRISLHRII